MFNNKEDIMKKLLVVMIAIFVGSIEYAKAAKAPKNTSGSTASTAAKPKSRFERQKQNLFGKAEGGKRFAWTQQEAEKEAFLRQEVQRFGRGPEKYLSDMRRLEYRPGGEILLHYFSQSSKDPSTRIRTGTMPVSKKYAEELERTQQVSEKVWRGWE